MDWGGVRRGTYWVTAEGYRNHLWEKGGGGCAHRKYCGVRIYSTHTHRKGSQGWLFGFWLGWPSREILYTETGEASGRPRLRKSWLQGNYRLFSWKHLKRPSSWGYSQMKLSQHNTEKFAHPCSLLHNLHPRHRISRLSIIGRVDRKKCVLSTQWTFIPP